MEKAADGKERINIQPTGIKELDEIVSGGIPHGATILVSGASGTGKTILTQQWLFEGYNKFSESGLYISLTEQIDKSLRNARQFSFFDEEAVNPLNIHFTDLRAISEGLELDGKKEFTHDDLEKLLDLIEGMVKEMNAQRVVLDSITAFLYRLRDKDLIRTFIFKLNKRLAQSNATILMTSEVVGDGVSAFGVEEFIADGIINLTYTMGEQTMVRRLQVLKLRGVNFRSAPVVFDINEDGILIYPKIPIDRHINKTEFSNRVKTGIEGLDEMTGGGYPIGHMILIGGNTGTGKTTFGLQFLMEGINNNETVLFVSLEESIAQVNKTALEHGWNFEQYENEGSLNYINPSLIDIYPDKLLYQIVDSVKKNDVKRIFIDSASSLLSATMDKDVVREFLLQLTNYLKTKGVTSVFTYMSDVMFDASSGQLLGSTEASRIRMSSIVDGVILLRYTQQKNTIKKLISVLKMRGSDHDRDIREFSVEKNGIKIGGTFHE